jgi:hypothetical protein
VRQITHSKPFAYLGSADMGEEQYEFTQDRMAHKLVTVHKSTFQTMDDMLSQADANISLKELRGVCPYVYGNGCVGYQTTDVDYTDLDFYYNKCRKFHERGYTNVRVLFGIAAV